MTHAIYQHATETIRSIESMMAKHDQQRSTIIRIFPADGLAFDTQKAASYAANEYRGMGYTVSGHLTANGNPYVKATTQRIAA